MRQPTIQPVNRTDDRPYSRDAVFWFGSVLIAPPVAWIVAAAGYGLARGDPWHDLAYLGLWSVAEEVVFRGGLQRALLPKLAARAGGISAANLGASLLFACAHLWTHPALVALGVLPVSLVLGAAYERSGRRLVAPIALHLYFNGLLYASTWLLGR